MAAADSFNERWQIRVESNLTQHVLDLIKDQREKGIDKYIDLSHFVRVAVIRLLREEGLKI